MTTRKRMLMSWLSVIAIMSLLASVGVASASEFTQFGVEKAPVKLKATQTESVNLTFNLGAFSCTNGVFEGESSMTSFETQLLSISYSGCSYLGVVNVPINPNGCQFKLHATGTEDIVCPAGKFIEWEAMSCTLKIGSQTGLGTVSYQNVGSGTARSVNVIPNISGITYTQSALCSGGAGTFHNGTYKNGKSNLAGKTSKGIVEGVFVS